MGEVRVLIPKGASPARTVGEHVRDLQARGRIVIYVAADRPHKTLVSSFAEFGIDADRVHFIDLVSAANGHAPMERVANAMFLASPTMLEMLAMRVEQLIARLGTDSFVIVDSLNTLSLYNGEAPVQEFTHYLANRLRERRIPGDLIVRDGAESQSLQSKIASFTDARFELNPRD